LAGRCDVSARTPSAATIKKKFQGANETKETDIIGKPRARQEPMLYKKTQCKRNDQMSHRRAWVIMCLRVGGRQRRECFGDLGHARD